MAGTWTSAGFLVANPDDPLTEYELVTNILSLFIIFLFVMLSIAGLPLYLVLGFVVFEMETPWYLVTMRCISIVACGAQFMTMLFKHGYLAPVGKWYHFIPLYVAYTLELITISLQRYIGNINRAIYLLDYVITTSLFFGLCFIGSRNDLEDGYWSRFKVFYYRRRRITDGNEGNLIYYYKPCTHN